MAEGAGRPESDGLTIRRISARAMHVLSEALGTLSARSDAAVTTTDEAAGWRSAVVAAGAQPQETSGAAQGSAPVVDSDAAWDELVRAGLATARGTVDPRWAQVLRGAAAADHTYRVVARQGELGTATSISLMPAAGLGVSVTERRRLQVTDAEVVVAAVEDAVEIALFRAKDLWGAVRRVLPQVEQVVADPAPTLPRDEVSVAEVDLAAGETRIPEMLHEALAGAQVEVSLGMLVLLEDDRSVSAQRHWALTDQGLLEVRVRPTDVEVVRVEPGAIGHELVWITTGALQMQSEGRRSA